MKRWIMLLVVACVSLPAVLVAEDLGGEARSVKSGKSNSDNRSGAGSEDAAAEHVKGSKSNTSERGTGGAAGDGGAADRATSVRSGKSNSDN